MELPKLTSLENLQIGDVFTMITPDFEDVIIQFVGRKPELKNNEYSKKSGYFATVCGPKKCFILEEDDLKDKSTDYYIGYDEEFSLERRIEKVQNTLLIPLQDQLLRLRELRAKKP